MCGRRRCTCIVFTLVRTGEGRAYARSETARRILTLARKFDAVQRNTVTSKRLIPSVLLAIFHTPLFGRKLGMLPQDMDEPVMCSGGSDNPRTGASYSAWLSLANVAACEAIAISSKRSGRGGSRIPPGCKSGLVRRKHLSTKASEEKKEF